MSRNYDVQVEVYPCTHMNDLSMPDVLGKWGLEIDANTESFDDDDLDGWSFWGSIRLTCGNSPDRKHEELRALLPDRAVTTRWRYVDEQPWDDVISTDPLRQP